MMGNPEADRQERIAKALEQVADRLTDVVELLKATPLVLEIEQVKRRLDAIEPRRP